MNQTSNTHAGAKYTSFQEYEDSITTTKAARVFVDVLQRNPEVCSNCFTKIRDVYFPHDVALDKRGEHTESWKGLVRYFIAKADRVEPAKIDDDRARNPPNACAGCGSIRGSTIRPLDKSDAVEYAWNLSETLRLLDVEHNPLLLAFVVTFRKQFPEYASRDDDTYRVAVEYALDETTYTIADVLENGLANPAYPETAPRLRRRRPALPPAHDADD